MKVLLILALLAASVATGCARSDDCRSFPDTPRIIHLFEGRASLEEVAGMVEAQGWTLHEDPVPRGTDRVYAGWENGTARLVLAYYASSEVTGSAAEVYALAMSSGSDARTREILAPAAPALAALNATLGAPTEVKVEGLTTQCASRWVPEGCEPGPRKTREAPWEKEPTPVTASAQGGCGPLMAD